MLKTAIFPFVVFLLFGQATETIMIHCPDCGASTQVHYDPENDFAFGPCDSCGYYIEIIYLSDPGKAEQLEEIRRTEMMITNMLWQYFELDVDVSVYESDSCSGMYNIHVSERYVIDIKEFMIACCASIAVVTRAVEWKTQNLYMHFNDQLWYAKTEDCRRIYPRDCALTEGRNSNMMKHVWRIK